MTTAPRTILPRKYAYIQRMLWMFECGSLYILESSELEVPNPTGLRYLLGLRHIDKQQQHQKYGHDILPHAAVSVQKSEATDPLLSHMSLLTFW